MKVRLLFIILFSLNGQLFSQEDSTDFKSLTDYFQPRCEFWLDNNQIFGEYFSFEKVLLDDSRNLEFHFRSDILENDKDLRGYWRTLKRNEQSQEIFSNLLHTSLSTTIGISEKTEVTFKFNDSLNTSSYDLYLKFRNGHTYIEIEFIPSLKVENDNSSRFNLKKFKDDVSLGWNISTPSYAEHSAEKFILPTKDSVRLYSFEIFEELTKALVRPKFNIASSKPESFNISLEIDTNKHFLAGILAGRGIFETNNFCQCIEFRYTILDSLNIKVSENTILEHKTILRVEITSSMMYAFNDQYFPKCPIEKEKYFTTNAYEYIKLDPVNGAKELLSEYTFLYSLPNRLILTEL